MEHEELWREFAPNGEAKDVGWVKWEYMKLDKICGSAHVWVWRRGATGDMEVLMQLRAADEAVWPDHWDISTAGHINVDETALEAAVREANEEINLKLDPERLEYVFCDRRVTEWYEEFRYVFIYEMIDELKFEFNDGEVDELKWVSLSDLKEWVGNSDGRSEKIVPHPPYYFAQLFEWLEKVGAKGRNGNEV